MHWGHAVSSDLLHWTELPIALYPHDGIYMFSGSMVCDDSGREDAQEASDGDAKKELFAAFYTSHREEGHLESQSVAFSHDEGVSFTEYAHNPVIETPSDPADPSGKTILSTMWAEIIVFCFPSGYLMSVCFCLSYRIPVIRENQLRNKLKSDRLLYRATALDESAHPSAEQPTNEGVSLSSAGKVKDLFGNEKGKGKKLQNNRIYYLS
jgi:hypothetical protein